MNWAFAQAFPQLLWIEKLKGFGMLKNRHLAGY